MPNARSLLALAVLTIGVLTPAARPRAADQRPALADELANTFGISSFEQIDAIRYTFNIDLAALKLKLSRSWVWEPKTGQVSYESKDKDGKPVKVTYTRSQVSTQSATVKDQIDPSFINDQYWLLFPFHVVWDSAAKVEDAGMQKLPQGKGTARKLLVTYPSGVGYTPGDTWALFVGKDGRVEQMEFHHGGEAKPSVVIASWAGYRKAGPLLVSTEHRGTADAKPFHLRFTNVAVRLAGSSTWTEAK